MSFLKITDPKKRDFIVEEFVKTKKNVQDSYLSERLGDIGEGVCKTVFIPSAPDW